MRVRVLPQRAAQAATSSSYARRGPSRSSPTCVSRDLCFGVWLMSFVASARGYGFGECSCRWTAEAFPRRAPQAITLVAAQADAHRHGLPRSFDVVDVHGQERAVLWCGEGLLVLRRGLRRQAGAIAVDSSSSSLRSGPKVTQMCVCVCVSC